jgi:hypothetical protein
MEPLLSLTLRELRRAYQPGEELEWEYQIDAVEADRVQAVESSVLWYAEGKGDEDMAVHYFERRVPADDPEGDLRPMRRVRVTLPNSPLSYPGALFAIRWCVRVRVFYSRGKERNRMVSIDHPFQLGSVPPATPVPEPEAEDVASQLAVDDEGIG